MTAKGLEKKKKRKVQEEKGPQVSKKKGRGRSKKGGIGMGQVLLGSRKQGGFGVFEQKGRRRKELGSSRSKGPSYARTKVKLRRIRGVKKQIIIKPNMANVHWGPVKAFIKKAKRKSYAVGGGKFLLGRERKTAGRGESIFFGGGFVEGQYSCRTRLVKEGGRNPKEGFCGEKEKQIMEKDKIRN